ncbi:MAG: DUF928 domain-containing protein [Myxococcales bacterium]|nr:MAG: DUF928 domain-containing protein [Myxococcales bacterium]
MLRFAIASLAFALAAAAHTAEAAEEGQDGSAAATAGAVAPDATAAPAPVYRLPKVGKPRGRIGGGRRGPITGVADVRVLVPDHVGQTTSAQPSLYWYLAEPVKGEVILEFAVIDDTSIDPLLDRRLTIPASTGLQRVRLSELGISLEPEQEYQWSVAVVSDPEDHSKDVVGSGWVQRVSAPDALAEQLAAAGPEGAASVYGEAGLWYDMLDAAFERIRANPESENYREQLAVVLEEAGLPGEAARQRP